MSRRFLLYVKAASDGLSLGDCPFCQRVMMYANIKMPADQLEIKTVNTQEKPAEFLQLNPEGKVPVLVDRNENDKIITDSAEINKYIDAIFPPANDLPSGSGPANDACKDVFGKVAALIKNKDATKSEVMKEAMTEELRKIENYLQSREVSCKYLVGDEMNEIDCMILPRLRHLTVAGKHYRGYEIPAEFTRLKNYISGAEQDDIYKSTCCPDKELIYGWGQHL